jgi:hypothetical protein
MVWKPDYCTLVEAKAYVKVEDTDDDTQFALAVTAASRAIDDETERQFGQTAGTEARRYDARWDKRRTRWLVDVDDIQDVTGLAVAVAAGAVTPFDLLPLNAALTGKPYERLLIKPESANQPTGTEEGEVTVTAKYGWNAVPVTIKLATLLQISRWHSRRDAPFGVAGSPDQGSEIRLLARVDPDVKVMLRGYYRWWGAR